MIIRILIIAWCLGAWAFRAEAQVAVIAHAEVPADSVTKDQLLDFFTGDIRAWIDGAAVVVVDLKPRSDVKETFYDFLGKKPSRMKSIWLRKMLSGEFEPPEALETEAEMLEKISTTPGAIGFVHKTTITAEAAVKILVEIPMGEL